MLINSADSHIYTKEDLEKLEIIAKINKFDMERQVLVENLNNQSRANRESNAKDNVSRIYTFYDPVRAESVSKCVDALGQMSRRDPGQDIKIVLNSPGGNVLDGLALFDFIQTLKGNDHKIEVVALGVAASMGGILLQAGDIRTIGKNSWMLIHEVTAGMVGSASEMENELEVTKRLQDGLVEILAERSSLTTAQIKRKWKGKDWWLNSKECLENGFVDRIQA